MTSSLEQLVLGGLALNDATKFTLEALTFSPAQPKPQWVSNANADGDLLVEEAHYDNCSFELQIRVHHTESTDAALKVVGELMDRLQGCQASVGGTALKWTPNGSTRTYTAYAILAEVSEVPVTIDGELAGWFLNSPVLKVKVTCRPFLYADERVVLAAVESGAEPLQIAYVKGVEGDVPAEARMVLTDAATQKRRYADWGLETVASEAGNPALLLTAASTLTVTGFAGESTTRAGAYSEEKVKRLKVAVPGVTMCSTGAIANVGTFRVKARLYAEAEGMQVRMSYRVGSGPLISLEWIELPVTEKWAETDLGEVTLEELAQGTQRSEIFVEAKTLGTVGKSLDLNYLTMVPTTAGFGKARGPASPLRQPTILKARDEFDQTKGALNEKSLPDGSGKWATSGSAKGDFEVNGSGEVTRSAKEDTEGRFAKCPAAESAAMAAQVSFELDKVATGVVSDTLSLGLMVSNTDTSGLYAVFALEDGTAAISLFAKNVMSFLPQPNVLYTLTLLVVGNVFASGWLTANGAFPFGEPDVHTYYTAGVEKSIARIKDKYAGKATIVRTYDNFSTWVPEIVPVCESGKSFEVNSSAAEHADSAGTYWGPVPFYRGGRFYLPAAGESSRLSRLVARMRRNDLEGEEVDEAVTDKHKLEVLARERFLTPR